jgi:homoserine O-acetyltransferase
MSNEFIIKGANVARLQSDYGSTGFKMFKGSILNNVEIAYETWGSLSNNNDNAVLIFTGLSTSSHAASSVSNKNDGWWEYMIGPNKPIDTNKYFVVCVNSLGSCFGSTSPAAINKKTEKIYGLDFPELSIEDIAKAGHSVLQSLGVDHAHTVIGPSMGGMTSLAYALLFPDSLSNLIVISAAARALPFTISIRSLQRELIRSDPLWNKGVYTKESAPLNGMKLARKLGLMSYRAANEWRERFNRARLPKSEQKDMFDIEFEVENYLDHNSEKFVSMFDPNCYLYLSRAMDLFDVAEHGGTVNAGLAKIHTKNNLIVGVESDILFPIDQQQELANGFSKARKKFKFEKLNSIQGHDSFLVDEKNFSKVIYDFFNE